VEARFPEATAGNTSNGDLQAALSSESARAESELAESELAESELAESALQGSLASLAFAPNSAELSGDAEGVLNDLATRFPVEDEAIRLQLMAYAGGEDMSASKARRLSLARALAVRSYLMSNGIDGARMDVRALGDRILDPAAGAPTDRVDIAMIRR
jgi:outer membrane protein OmpA-like peptidoglycan-associated protein